MAETALRNNSDVQALMKILRQNGLKKQYGEFTSLINYVGEMENQLKTAMNELNSVQRQLDAIKDSRHPLKTALTKTVENLKNTINALKEKIGEVKNAIIEGAKNALAEFQHKGLSALHSLTSFFKIKDGLNAIRENADNTVKSANSTISKIDQISHEIHAAGSHRRNIFRVLTGRKKQNDIKTNGKIAKFAQLPFRAVKGAMVKIRDTSKEAVKKLEQLDKMVQKPSVLKPVKEFKPPEREKNPDKSKKIEAAIE